MGRRFLQSLEQGIESLRREHVHFVDNIHFVPAEGGGVLDSFPKVPNLFNPPIGSRVHLNYVHRRAAVYPLAELALVAGLGHGTLGAETVDPLSQYLCRRRLAGASGAGKKVGMGQLAGGKGILQGFYYMFLTDKALGKTPGPVAAVQCLVGQDYPSSLPFFIIL